MKTIKNNDEGSSITAYTSEYDAAFTVAQEDSESAWVYVGADDNPCGQTFSANDLREFAAVLLATARFLDIKTAEAKQA